MICLLCGANIYPKFTIRQLCTFIPITEEPICEQCRQKIVPLAAPRCPQCARPQATTDCCADCQIWRIQYQWTFQNHAFYHYHSSYRDWLLLLKGAREQRLAGIFRQDLQGLKRRYPKYTWVPIPSQITRAQQRGFHQTEVILHASRIPYRSLLEDSASKKTAGTTRAQRLQQVDKFQLKTTERLPERVILFDDVYTTGATLYSAYQVLKAGGVKEIIGVALAR